MESLEKLTLPVAQGKEEHTRKLHVCGSRDRSLSGILGFTL